MALYGPDSMSASADNGCPVGWGANPELQVRMIVQYQGEPWNKGLLCTKQGTLTCQTKKFGR